MHMSILNSLSARLVEQNGMSGVVTSMLYPHYVYTTLGVYQWRIRTNSSNLIRITIDNCILKRDSVIRIYDGYDSSSESLQIIETDNIPNEAILSSTNIVLIEFEINTFSESKFKLLWSAVPIEEAAVPNVTDSLNCTQNSVIVVNESETIKLRSPGYPSGYDGGLSCTWSFVPAKMGYHVDISFKSLDLEAAENCLPDAVMVGSGADLDHTFEMGPRWCNINQITRRNRFHGAPILRVKLETDYVYNRTGFEADVLLDCGGVLEGSEGRITNQMTISERTQYWMNDTCTWSVKVKPGRTIQFNFEQLNLVHDEDGSCISYIIIRNGIHDDSPFLGSGKYCANTPSIPPTSSNRAIVQFVRSRAVGRSLATNDFVLKYQQVEYECGGSHTIDYNNNETIITSPHYPNIPSPHIECKWRITAPNGELLKIEFLERFDLTTTPTCSSEYVEVREGATSTAPFIAKYCQEKPQPIFSASNMISIKYFTDVAVPKNGFKAKVSFARCGKSIVQNNGFITSPGFPGKGAYPRGTTCDYHITGRTGTVLNITFLALDLPEARNCSEVDHVIIYSVVRNSEGNISYSEVAKVCGSEKPEPLIMFRSMALVKFVTISSNSLYRGFRFKFESTIDICGSRIQASTGIIQSPGYPVSQDTSRDCEWLITVPKGRRVKIDVLDFDGTPIPINAVNSFYKVDQRISFYNDFLFSSPISSLFPRNESYAPIRSSDNTMAVSALIRRSNAGHRGFKLRFSSDEPSICEGNLNDIEGSFQTPANVTRFYCEFTRDSHRPFFDSEPTVGTISLKISEDTQNSENRTRCLPNMPTGIAVMFANNDRVMLSSKCPPKYDNIASPYPTTKVMLRSSLFHAYRFVYKVNHCGGLLPATTTSIQVSDQVRPNLELDCAWLYTSNNDRNIQMLVNAPAMNCDNEYLNIYRGRNGNRQRMARFCGDAASNRSVIIVGSYAFVEYHSDNYNAGQNFKIDIVTFDGTCGGLLNAPNYVFSSPKNGTKYPANTECEWILVARNGYHIGLTFTKRFMLETSNLCTKDYIKVYDMVDNEYREISRLCGRDYPAHLNSTGQRMKVTVFDVQASGQWPKFYHFSIK